MRQPALALVCVAAALLYALAGLGAERAKTDSKKSNKPAAQDARKSEPSRHRQQQLRSEQQDLKNELTKLKRQLMATEASRGEAADALAASETAISKANRRLRELAEARGQVERQIDGLQQRGRAVTASQAQLQAKLGESLRQQYQLSLHDPWKALFAGDNPGALARDAEYYAYISRAAVQRIDELEQRRQELAGLEEESRKKRQELAMIADDEAKSRASVMAEQARRKQALDRLSRQIASQRQSIDKLERDEKRLATLIDQISKVLAEQARREAEREAAARAARDAQAKAAKPGPPAPRPAPPSPEAEPPPSSHFAQLRGRLPMPVVGEVTGRFGAPRPVEGGGTAPTWKGIFIRAAAGAGVHAVSAGQVVFADWLRGFGNLMVVDHGEGFLSVYGNNESLLRNVGDKVAVGDVIAAVGNTGGIEQTGLYFELRFQGRPFDPLKWVAAR